MRHFSRSPDVAQIRWRENLIRETEQRPGSQLPEKVLAPGKRPVDQRWIASQDLNLRAALVQQRRGFECALTSSDYRHALSLKSREIVQIRRVRGQISRDIVELLRPAGEESNAEGQNNRLGLHSFAVVEGQFKKSAIVGNVSDATSIEMGHNLFLKPFAVRDEVLDRHWIGNPPSDCLLVSEDGEVLLWSRDIGRFILGAEEHPTRHTVLPECHRLPKNIGIYSGMLQMGGRAQPVR